MNEAKWAIAYRGEGVSLDVRMISRVMDWTEDDTEHLKNKILYPHKFFQENLHDVAVNHLGEGKNGHGENTVILSIYKQWLTLATYCYNAVILLLLLFGVREWKKWTVAKSKCLVGIENKESIEEIKRCLH